MRLDVARIDETISKLQEIRRIASDPELVSMLLQFLTAGEGEAAPASPLTVRAGDETRPQAAAPELEHRYLSDPVAAEPPSAAGGRSLLHGFKKLA